MELLRRHRIIFLFFPVVFLVMACNTPTDESITPPETPKTKPAIKNESSSAKSESYDTADYSRRLLALSNGDTTGRWPAKAAYPLPGAVLPYHRIVAYYGNLYSKNMGILGELPKDSMIKRLKEEVEKWEQADPTVPVKPALHYIAVTAQKNWPQKRLRMPFKQIDTIMQWAKEIDALVFIDIQVGWSTLQNEIPELKKYLMLPNVHLGIDPEFSMKSGNLPGTVIGTFDADDVNYATGYLAGLVKEYRLPPKILVVHRFTAGMVTNAEKINTMPEVQIVMDMDGWGDKPLKRSTWRRYIYREPVQFTGFKLFYKNDTKQNKNGLYTPEELLKFIPKPIYIQYQ